jgi:NAD(P)-dependent dehydrogenase (short-subunit alcohol dehydrogenase family)
MQVLQLDVCDDASVAAAVEHILGVDGKIDVLINNAGYSVFGGVEMVGTSAVLRAPLSPAAEQLSMDDMKAQFETNFFGCIRTIRAVSPAMRAARKGQSARSAHDSAQFLRCRTHH